MKKIITTGVLCAFLSVQSAAAANLPFAVGGATKVVKQDESIVVSPYNRASFLGVGTDGALSVMTPSGQYRLPLSSPLYSLNSAYTDQITTQEDQWGVLRRVGTVSFDGSEDWQLVTNSLYKSGNTTVFSLLLDETPVIPDLLCSHFQTLLDAPQRTNTIDGVSLSADLKYLYVRVMNFRNLTTVEQWKAFLAAQNQEGNPLTVLYAKQPVFSPFDNNVQKTLSQIDLAKSGFIDSQTPIIQKAEPMTVSLPFADAELNDQDAYAILQAVTDIRIYNGDPDASYQMQSFRLQDQGRSAVLEVKKAEQAKQAEPGTPLPAPSSPAEPPAAVLSSAEPPAILYRGTLAINQQTFNTNKPVEVRLHTADPADGAVMLYFDLSRLLLPAKDVTFSETPVLLSPSCLMEKRLVLPEQIPVLSGKSLPIFENNILLNGDSQAGDRISFSAGEEGGKSVTVSAEEAPVSCRLFLNGAYQKETRLLPVPLDAGAGEDISVMLLGDSLINQNHYPAELAKLFSADPMAVTLIGTKGADSARHEGRGGWSAYDYCRVEKKYGEDNLFLHNGKFDFSYYMENLGTPPDAPLDAVVLNLGINDLNLIGHNSEQEIFSYFDEIVASIRAYRPDTKIFFNTPTMLFAKDTTETAKNARLSFIESLTARYGESEDKGLYIIPIYLPLDPFLDYKFEQRPLNAENQDKSMEVRDTTHPALSGYQKIADMTYCYLKYAWQ